MKNDYAVYVCKREGKREERELWDVYIVILHLQSIFNLYERYSNI